MKRTVGTTRMVVAGMVLMAGALGIFGDMKSTATDPSFAGVSGTDHAWAAPQPKSGTPAGVAHVLPLAARGRSGDADPCVPISPVDFSVRGASVC
jgi:hypothetical protein